MQSEFSRQLMEFDQKIGAIWIDGLLARGIVTSSIAGYFERYQVQYLEQLCLAAPDLHIISHQKRWEYNRYVPDALYYQLGDGDDDPSLEFEMIPMTLLETKQLYERLLNLPESERDGCDRFLIDFLGPVVASGKTFDHQVFIETALIEK